MCRYRFRRRRVLQHVWCVETVTQEFHIGGGIVTITLDLIEFQSRSAEKRHA